jgi:hypothetical protein
MCNLRRSVGRKTDTTNLFHNSVKHLVGGIDTFDERNI